MFYHNLSKMGRYKTKPSLQFNNNNNLYERAKYLEYQRYVYVTGISVFTYVVNWRLLKMVTKMHAWRELMAAANAANANQLPAAANVEIGHQEGETERRERREAEARRLQLLAICDEEG
jgi:hypothetical protein